MRPPIGLFCGLLATLSLFTGCAQQTGEDVFTVRQIDSSARDNGAVRVRLTTPGNLAEADESSLVAFVKIVAVHEATREQQRLAAARAHAILRQLAVHPLPGKARYLAISTQKSAGPKSSGIAESVILWDTQSQSIVGANVYDIAERPATGQVARFETYSAQYVGSGF